MKKYIELAKAKDVKTLQEMGFYSISFSSEHIYIQGYKSDFEDIPDAHNVWSTDDSTFHEFKFDGVDITFTEAKKCVKK